HRLMRRLLGYLRPYRTEVAAAVAVVLVDAVMQLAGPWLTMQAVDNGIRHHDLGYLDRVAVLYLSVLLVSFGLGYLQTQLMQNVGQRIMMDLRMASFRDIRTQLARLNAYLNENLSGMSTVQILNRERRNFEGFRGINAGHRDANLRAVHYHALFFPVLELVGALAVSLIVWYGGRQVMWTGITLGTLVAFIQYTQRFFRPISDLSEKYNILQQAMASSERIFDLLDTPAGPEIPAL